MNPRASQFGATSITIVGQKAKIIIGRKKILNRDQSTAQSKKIEGGFKLQALRA
jgi:hypothetical protein